MTFITFPKPSLDARPFGARRHIGENAYETQQRDGSFIALHEPRESNARKTNTQGTCLIPKDRGQRGVGVYPCASGAHCETGAQGTCLTDICATWAPEDQECEADTTLTILTDPALFDAVGVRIAFTGRAGGVSAPPFDSLNVGHHVGDDLTWVQTNRRLVQTALGAEDTRLLVPNQVHGTDLVTITPGADITAVQTSAAEGCDGVVVTAPGVMPLLCFADCAPVIIVAPTKTFAVVHAGWRGAVAHIVSKALAAMAAADGEPLGTYAPQCNIYIGPHIGVECFETGAEVQQQFVNAFGAACVTEEGHVNLTQAIIADACGVGAVPDRILDAGLCTQCHPHEYFSYRASGGRCGRHGACAFYLEDEHGISETL